MSSTAPGLSACVVAMNEEDRIEACLRSLAFCDEVVVVDSYSSDRTCEVAEGLGARVVRRAWPGFGPQKNHAASLAKHEWVLNLDADERVSEALRLELEDLRRAGFSGASGWSMPRLSRYLGRWMRHGGWYPDRQLRLYDRRRGSWNGAEPHPRVTLEGPMGKLAGDLEHHPYRNLDEHLRTIDRYTTVMAEGMHARGRRASSWRLITNPGWGFARCYLFKRGFLEGWQGLVQAFLAAHYIRLKYTKLLVLQRTEEPG